MCSYQKINFRKSLLHPKGCAHLQLGTSGLVKIYPREEAYICTLHAAESFT